MCPAGTVRSSWDLTVLSVSVLDWSDSELLTFAFPLFPGDTLRIKEGKEPSVSTNSCCKKEKSITVQLIQLRIVVKSH